MDIIRKYIETDLDAVMYIWFQGNKTAHAFIGEEYWKRNFNYVRRAISQSEVYVYEFEGKVIGFIGLDEGYVQGLFVHPDFTREGIGSRLLNYIKEDLEFFTLHVFQKNEAAVSFYQKNGLKIKETQVNEDLGEEEYYMYYRKPKKENEA